MSAVLLAGDVGGLARGGVYVVGGILRKILPLLKSGSSMESFANKGLMSQLVSAIPVHVVLRPGVGLLGAANSGFESMRHNPKLSWELG